MPIDELHVTLQSEKSPGFIYVSFNAPRPAVLIDIYGSEKILKIDILNQTIVELWYRTLSKIDSLRDSLGLSYKISASTMRNGLEYLLRARGEYSFHYVYNSFAKSIKEGKEPLVSPIMACNTVRIVEEICRGI